MNIESFIDSLNAGDVGHEEVDGNIVYFEGFTGECWLAAEENDKSIDELEAEMLSDWSQRNGGLELIESGWTDEPFPFEDTIFYAVYNKRI